ncbi:hypothetical protein LINPERHAP1_LOCUS13658 [Linum perenne]
MLSSFSAKGRDSPKSFAQVVKGKVFSLEGSCLKSKLGDCFGVKVEEKGVADRLEFLQSCLVFRFCSTLSINWSDFRWWASKNWGIQATCPIFRLGDGMWLLSCGTKEMVDRIIALRRWMFGEVQMKLDSWISEAGHSNVLFEEEKVWITVRGIPLHLRSEELFKQVGDICGTFLEFDSGDSLSSVRLGIQLTGVIPEEIPILHGNHIFPVRVEVESVVSKTWEWREFRSFEGLERKRERGVCSEIPLYGMSGRERVFIWIWSRSQAPLRKIQ